jgi:PAS domain S-box-containing protein
MKAEKAMENSHNQPNKIFEPLSQPEVSKEFPKEIASDALSIIFDAINSSVGGLIITDLGGIIRFANPSFCKMFDYLSTEIIGKNAAELFSTKEVRTFADVISIVDISRDDTEEFVVEKNDGESFIVELSASNVTSVSGKIVGRMASFVDITKRKAVEADREQLIKKLQDALDKIKTLRGIIPICASCKKIRDDKGYWNQLENYIKEHSEADFSHGICPDCAKKLYPKFYK